MRRNGPWIAFNTAFLRNAKIEAVSANAVVLYISLLCESGDNLTDGFVREGSLPRLLGEARATSEHLDELVRVGLLEAVEDGWVVPGYLVWNPTREWWVRRREADARRQAKRSQKLREVARGG